MKPLPHIIASGMISALSAVYFRSAKYVVISFLAGVLIDGDHVIDYWLNNRPTLNIKKIYKCCLRIDLPKLYLGLHSYELVMLLWISIYLFSLSFFWQAIALGITQHIILDQLTNSISILAYFFTYRFMNGFKKEQILRQGKR